jgi:hypothetical protein
MISRSIRRRLEKFLRQGDARERCSICQDSFAHNVRTYSGIAVGGALARVGECCLSRLKEVYFVGVFIRDKHGLYGGVPAQQPDKDKNYSAEETANQIARLQKAIETIDEEVGDLEGLAKRGGVKKVRFAGLADTPWKAADAEWFEQHPDRSHRMRLAMDGEAEALGFGLNESAPDGCRPIVLVRQIEPGKRMRFGLFMPAALMPIPESEALAHAFCDIASRDGGTGKPITKAEVMTLYQRYARDSAAARLWAV